MQAVAVFNMHRTTAQIDTLVRKSNFLKNASTDLDACIRVSSNLQKDRMRGVNGLMFEYDGELDLAHLESLTERVFGGVSFVRCIDNEHLRKVLCEDESVLQEHLESFCTRKRNLPQKSTKLNDLMPGLQTSVDFYWANVAVKYIDDRRKNTMLIDDHNKHRVVFYNLCVCVQDDDLSQCADYAVRDTAPWTSMLDGYMGLYKQQHSNGESYYLGCNSHMPGIATTFVTSLKQDLAHGTSIQQYVNSKEMWFIENIEHCTPPPDATLTHAVIWVISNKMPCAILPFGLTS